MMARRWCLMVAIAWWPGAQCQASLRAADSQGQSHCLAVLLLWQCCSDAQHKTCMQLSGVQVASCMSPKVVSSSWPSFALYYFWLAMLALAGGMLKSNCINACCVHRLLDSQRNLQIVVGCRPAFDLPCTGAQCRYSAVVAT